METRLKVISVPWIFFVRLTRQIRQIQRYGNQTLRPVQTLATLLANKTQHCWAQHVGSVCTPCCVLLRVVATSVEVVGWSLTIFKLHPTTSNKSQQHSTTHNMVCKGSQHVGPNNVASCWPTMLRASAQAFTFSSSSASWIKFIQSWLEALQHTERFSRPFCLLHLLHKWFLSFGFL